MLSPKAFRLMDLDMIQEEMIFSQSQMLTVQKIEDGSHDDVVCIVEREGGSHDPQDDVIYIRTTSDLAKRKEARKGISQQLEKQKIQPTMTSFFRAGPLDEDQVRKNAERKERQEREDRERFLAQRERKLLAEKERLEKKDQLGAQERLK